MGESPITVDRAATLGSMRVRPTSVSSQGAGSRVAFEAVQEPPTAIGLARTTFHFHPTLVTVNDVACQHPLAGAMEERSGNEMSGCWDFEHPLPPGTTFELEIELAGQIDVVRCVVDASNTELPLCEEA